MRIHTQEIKQNNNIRKSFFLRWMVSKSIRRIALVGIALCLSLTLFNYTFANSIDRQEDAYSTTKEVQAPIDIKCRAYLLMDLDSGQVLYEKNADKKIFPASTTKVMTSILALETLSPNDTVTISQAAIDDIGDGGMNIGCVCDEEFKFKDIIKAVLLTSANECANAIAEASAPSREEFLNRMNNKAKEIGANSTNFINVHGMFDKNHYTTARNLAAIARYAMVQSPAHEKFCNIVKKSEYTLHPTNKHSVWYPYALPLTNKLRSYPSVHYNKVLGVKTGYIDKSGHNFIGAVQDSNGSRLLSVISGVDPLDAQNVFSSTQKLLDCGYSSFKKVKVVRKGTDIDDAIISNLSDHNDTLIATSASSVSAILPIDKKNNKSEDKGLVFDRKLNTNLCAPIKKGDLIGTLTIYRNGQVLGSTDLLAKGSMPLYFGGITKTIIIVYLALAFMFILAIVSLGLISKPKVTLQRKREQHLN